MRRDYQQRAISAAIEHLRELRSTLIVSPTGTGKTPIACGLMEEMGEKSVLFLANRKNLVWQAAKAIRRFTGKHVEIEMGDSKAGSGASLFGSSQVIVSSIQTQSAGGDGFGRMGKFDPAQFGLVIADEAHHFVAPGCRRVVEYYMNGNPDLKLVGLTATPDRKDELALGHVFQSVAFEYQILDAILDGWLVPVRQQVVNAEIDYSGIRSQAGDLHGADLAAVMESEKALHAVAGPTLDIVGDDSTLVFTASVKHAERLCEIFNRYKPGSALWVCGEKKLFSDEDRAEINRQFEEGEVQFLCNCGTHTEGYDSPRVKNVVMARPTESRVLYAQMGGRATRPHDSIVSFLNILKTPSERKSLISDSPKPHCTIIDFAGNSGKHKLVCTADILGGKIPEEVIKKVKDRVAMSGKPMEMVELLEEEEQNRLKRKMEEESKRAKLKVKSKFTSKEVDPFDVLQVKPVVARDWDRDKELTDRQKGMLRKNGINPDKLEFAEAKAILDSIFDRIDRHLCTPKQAKILKKHGYSTEMTVDQASKTLDALASNGWVRPMKDPVPKEEIGVWHDAAEPKDGDVRSVDLNSPAYYEEDVPF